MDTLKTDKGYLHKMVLLCDAGLYAVTIMLLCDLFSIECLQESQKIPELLTLRLVHLQGAVISGGKVSAPPLALLFHDH